MLGFADVLALFRLYDLRFEWSVALKQHSMGPVLGLFNGE